MSEPKVLPARGHQASEQYFLLADMSGYTAFLAAVEQTHGLDFSRGIPAGYDILGALWERESDPRSCMLLHVPRVRAVGS